MENRHETPELKDTELVLDNVDAHHLNRCETNPPSPQNEERAPTHIPLVKIIGSLGAPAFSICHAFAGPLGQG